MKSGFHYIHCVCRLAVCFALALLPFSGKAQQELMLHNLPDVWHSTSTNPAFFPENKKFALGLPGIALDAEHSGNITYNDIFVKQNGKTVIDFGNIIDKLDPENTIRFNQRNETVTLGFRLPGKFRLQAGHAVRTSGVIVYPKSLPELLWNGNGPYIGQTLQIGLQADVSSWNEWSAGISREFGKLTLGVRAKLLTGMSSLITDPAHPTATIYTDPDIYQLTLHTDYAFYSSSIISAFDTSGLGFKVGFGSLKGKAFTQNTGAALDLGLQYRINDKWSLDASLLDLGAKIKWDTKANYFLSQGDYSYEGQTFPGTDIINGADSLDFTTKLDSLNDIFNFHKSAARYTTELPLRGYFGLHYQLTQRWQLGASAYFEHRKNAADAYAIGASARWQTFKWLSLGALYSINQRSATNLGFHVILQPGPLQLYFSSDNLLNAFTPKNSPAVNLRAGIALIL